MNIFKPGKQKKSQYDFLIPEVTPPLFCECDIQLLNELLRQLKEDKKCTSDTLAEFENKENSNKQDLIKHYEPFFEIFKKYHPYSKIGTEEGIIGVVSIDIGEVNTSHKNGGFQAIYDEHKKNEALRYKEILLYQKEIDESKLARLKVRYFPLTVAIAIISALVTIIGLVFGE